MPWTEPGPEKTRPDPLIFTVGHSNRSFADFLELLQAHGIDRILDVRRYPVSRKWPHFDAGPLAASLAEGGVEYVGLADLGGRRKPRPDSIHRAWRAESFRGFADFMDTREFRDGLEKVVALSRERRAALMCAEALPWKCHRSLIADSLVARGIPVLDVLSAKEARPHRLPAFARTDGARVVYDGSPEPG